MSLKGFSIFKILITIGLLVLHNKSLLFSASTYLNDIHGYLLDRLHIDYIGLVVTSTRFYDIHAHGSITLLIGYMLVLL